MTDTEQPTEEPTERRVVVVTIGLECLGQVLNLPDGYEVVAARQTEIWASPGIQMLVSGPDLPVQDPGTIAQPGYLTVSVMTGDERPERVLVTRLAEAAK